MTYGKHKPELGAGAQRGDSFDRTMRHREANDVSDAGGEERVDPDACDVRGVQPQPADACVGIGGHEDIAPRTARQTVFAR